jgi:hypothetical protein
MLRVAACRVLPWFFVLFLANRTFAAPGACCFDDGSCRLLERGTCLSSPGSCAWLGEGLPCDPNPCPSPFGACCFEDGTCSLTLEEPCAVARGIFLGCRTDCSPDPCPSGFGVCCVHSGECMLMTWQECRSLAEEAVCAFLEGNYPCDPNPCPQCCIYPCCLPSGNCITTCSDIFCRLLGGVPADTGEYSCFPNPCGGTSGVQGEPRPPVRSPMSWGKIKSIY